MSSSNDSRNARARGRRSNFSRTPPSARAARRKLDRVMLFEREPLRRRFDALEQEYAKIEKRRQEGATDVDALERRWNESLNRLNDDCDESIAKVDARRKTIPKIQYPSDLPVCERREEIRDLIRDNQVVIVCGETGSGKSTQIPKICLELGLGARGLIGHTQPRRIAARSIAQRVADELKTPLGQGVGYKIRFTDETSDRTLVKLMTDGILLAETQTDKYFNRYEVVIVDEAHERSLNVDFLLGMLKRALRVRRDLKVIVTSATIDAQRFAEHFASNKGAAPIVEVSGRTYPIEILYRSPADLKERREEETPGKRDLDDDDAFETTLLESIDEVCARGRGDVLVFMPTERDIFETVKLLKGRSFPGDDAARKTTILPLYARLTADEQQKIFQKVPHRKIVVATNVAESSLTVPGIRYVVDSGTARVSRYSPRSATQRLPIEPISQASADQRAGRCGRVGPGVCIRLYSQEDYEARPKYPTPEILRSNLASVILQTKALRAGEVEKFPFVDPPRRAAIEDGYKTLYEIGAVDENRELTEIGKTLSRIPVDPRIGRILLAAAQENVLRAALPIAAALEIQDPRERPRERQEEADAKHAQFLDENSDFLSYLKLWDFWENLKRGASRSQTRKACKQNFLSYNRMREWSDVMLQLLLVARELKLPLGERRDDYAATHRALLTGLLYGAARKSESSAEYESTNGGKFLIWPGSGVKKKPQWLVAAERLETSRAYLRTVARIEPEWIEELGDKLIKRTRKDPFWSRETGRVHAYERATLYGLTIVPRRRVNYGPIDPETSRRIFIYEALVQREFDCALPFFEHNGKIEEEAKRLRDKLRRHDFVKSYDAIYDFYDARLPRDVYDSISLKEWFKRASVAERKALFATLPDFCAVEDVDESAAELFPDALELDEGANLPIEYRFEPGADDDGPSVLAPVEALPKLDSKRLGWLVPGLLEMRVAALLKTLPKEIRRELIPMAETAKEIARAIPYGEGRLEDLVAKEVSARAQRRVSPDDFDSARTPVELQFNVKVVDEDGAIVAEGRDPDELRKRLGVEIDKTIRAVADPKWTRDGLASWDFGSLPETTTIRRASTALPAHPALCDPRVVGDFARDAADPTKSKTVALRLFESQEVADRQTRLGVLRLFTLMRHRELKTQARWLPGGDKLRLYAHAIPDFDFENAFAELIGARALDAEHFPLPRNEGEFNRLAADGAKRIPLAVQDLAGWAPRFLQAHQSARLAVERNLRGAARDAAQDAARQLERLFPPGFYLTTPWTWLKEYPRYLQAIAARLEKYFVGGAQTDAARAQELEEFWSRYARAVEKNGANAAFDRELETYRWMIEEYRVSLFAQKLGTSIKASAVRLNKLWDVVEGR